MAKLKVSGSASGTGTITLIAPATSTDRTITLPDESITLAGGVDGIVSTADATAITIDSSENVSFSNNTKIVGGNQQTQRLSWWNSTNYELASIENKSHGSYNDSGGLVFRTAAISSGGLQQRLEITSDGRGLSSFTAKAWAKFTGMSTPAFRAQHNMSSITDNGTGNYRLYYTNALGDSDYAVTTAGCAEAQWGEQPCVAGEATTYVDIHNVDEGGSYYDSSRLFFTVFSG